MMADKGKHKMDEKDNTTTPLWSHVTKIQKCGSSGGNWMFECNYCNKRYIGSYHRVKAHLLLITGRGVTICSALNDEVKMKLKSLQDEVDARKTMDTNRATSISYPCTVKVENKEGKVENKEGTAENKERNAASLKRKSPESAMTKSFNKSVRSQLDHMIARMFYASGLSFSLIRSPYFREVIQYACNNAQSLNGYKPPSYDKLRTTLLSQEKEHIEGLTKTIRQSWSTKGVSIVSDGWTDMQRRPLINFMAASQAGPLFLKSVDASGEVKDSKYMTKLFLQVIEDIGSENVVQIITDNAPVCRSAGLAVQAIHSNIFWTPCVVHTLNLALKNLCAPTNTVENRRRYEACKWIMDVGSDVRNIRDFIVGHHMTLSIFHKHSHLRMLGVAETRFASTIIMANRVKQVRQPLMQMVVSEEWPLYIDASDREKAAHIKQCVLSDEWWDKLDYLLKFTEPIVSMLREADTDAPMLHKVYEMWDSMIAKVQSIIFEHEKKNPLLDSSDFFDVVHKVLLDRWTKSNTPLHCMAHSLNPRYYSVEWLNERSSGTNRKAPHVDREISIQRDKCFEKLYENPIERQAIRSEYGMFSAELGDFGRWEVQKARYTFDPIAWWANNGSSTPRLQKLAFRLLTQPASSSCCERNWSTFSHIQTVKRNKMTSERVDDLVYVHSNLRLLSRKLPEYKSGPSKYWDALGDGMAVDGATCLEDANMTLDEPSLDSLIFEDDTNED